MADRELELLVKVLADTAGADQASAALQNIRKEEEDIKKAWAGGGQQQKFAITTPEQYTQAEKMYATLQKRSVALQLVGKDTTKVAEATALLDAALSTEQAVTIRSVMEEKALAASRLVSAAAAQKEAAAAAAAAAAQQAHQMREAAHAIRLVGHEMGIMGGMSRGLFWMMTSPIGMFIGGLLALLGVVKLFKNEWEALQKIAREPMEMAASSTSKFKDRLTDLAVKLDEFREKLEKLKHPDTEAGELLKLDLDQNKKYWDTQKEGAKSAREEGEALLEMRRDVTPYQRVVEEHKIEEDYRKKVAEFDKNKEARDTRLREAHLLAVRAGQEAKESAAVTAGVTLAGLKTPADIEAERKDNEENFKKRRADLEKAQATFTSVEQKVGQMALGEVPTGVKQYLFGYSPAKEALAGAKLEYDKAAERRRTFEEGVPLRIRGFDMASRRARTTQSEAEAGAEFIGSQGAENARATGEAVFKAILDGVLRAAQDRERSAKYGAALMRGVDATVRDEETRMRLHRGPGG